MTQTEFQYVQFHENIKSEIKDCILGQVYYKIIRNNSELREQFANIVNDISNEDGVLDWRLYGRLFEDVLGQLLQEEHEHVYEQCFAYSPALHIQTMKERQREETLKVVDNSEEADNLKG